MRLTDEQLLAAYRRVAVAGGRPAVHLRIAMLEARLAAAARREDSADIAVARRRLAEIEANPETVVRGPRLEARMAQWES